MKADEVSALETGAVVARAVLKTDEVVTVAAVKIRAPRDRVLDYYGQMIRDVDGAVTLAFGKFSTPPTANDVKDLAFDRQDIEDLRSCKPGKCDVRLSGAGIDALHRAVDWAAPDAADRVNAFARKAAVNYVAAYRAKGTRRSSPTAIAPSP